MFVIIFAFILPLLDGAGGYAVMDQRFNSRMACEERANDEVAEAVAHLEKDHERVIVEWVKCVPEEMLKPGDDA